MTNVTVIKYFISNTLKTSVSINNLRKSLGKIISKEVEISNFLIVKEM